jgi:hypothetical protein
MKVLTALPCVVAMDDSSTLLSLKVQTTLETGVDHLLEAVGSRNVSQMSSLVQNLVEETMDAPYELDGDVKEALTMIRDVLIADIRVALSEAHCSDQVQLHTQMECFEKCEKTKDLSTGSNGRCGGRCDGSAHKDCRDDLMGFYKEHISACRGLDMVVSEFNDKNCPMKAPKDCCLLPHTTWNCNCENLPKVEKMAVDNAMGEWLEEQLSIFTVTYESWKKHFKSCKKSYKAYLEQDAKCDCMQAECETQNCGYDGCHWSSCDGIYNECWGKCIGEKEDLHKDKECLEKDRKIDWSATEKMECFINVLLEKPTPEQLKAECGTDDCFSKYREKMYLKCNDICVAVDYDGAGFEEQSFRDGIDAWFAKSRTNEGDYIRDQRSHLIMDLKVAKSEMCRTKHRAGDAPKALVGEGGPATFEDGRCTSHLDLCYPDNPCCRPCAQCESSPCEGKGVTAHKDSAEWDHNSYMFKHYGQHNFLSETTVEGMESEVICHEQLEHSNIYAYNLCECIDCPEKQEFPPATCGTDNACPYAGADYNYRQHDIIYNCAAITSKDVHPQIQPPTEDVSFQGLCLDARGDNPASLKLLDDVCVSSIEFTHTSGRVSCRKPGSGDSNFGCDGDSLGLVIADGTEVVAPVFDSVEGLKPHYYKHAHWYRLPGVGRDSTSMEWRFTEPVVFNANNYKLWYNEDLTGGTEGDNRGGACYDVVVHKSESCNALAPLQFRNICLSAKGGKHDSISLPVGTCITEVAIHHISGWVACASNGNNHGHRSNFGCGQNLIGLVWTEHDKKEVVMPKAGQVEGIQRTGHGHAHWYHMDGVDKNTRTLSMKIEGSPLKTKSKTYDLWYNEDLTGGTERDNGGTACYEVAVHRALSC